MTATVTLTQAADAKVARLPLSAVLNRGTGPSVYVVEASGALALRPVTVASFTEDAALVTSGIGDGDKIVTLGVQKLEAGLKVRTVETQLNQSRGRVMKRFNLSEWAITHRPLVLFMIILLGAAGIYSYLNLGRAEDPSFTIKTMVVHVDLAGRDRDRDAGAGRRQDREEAAGAALISTASRAIRSPACPSSASTSPTRPRPPR